MKSRLPLVLSRAATLIGFVLTGVSMSGVAAAHPGHDTNGFAAGVLHPLTGVDHIFAMVAVGVWALRFGAGSKWLAPAAFISFMTVGSVLGAYSTISPFIEYFIAASVLVLGAGIVFSARIPASAGLAVIAISALLHGGVHGAEAEGGFGMLYLAGMLAATLALHVSGMALAALVKQRFGEGGIRWCGMPIALGGAMMLAGFA